MNNNNHNNQTTLMGRDTIEIELVTILFLSNIGGLSY